MQVMQILHDLARHASVDAWSDAVSVERTNARSHTLAGSR